MTEKALTWDVLYNMGEKVQFAMSPVKDWNGNVVKEAGIVQGVVEIVNYSVHAVQ